MPPDHRPPRPLDRSIATLAAEICERLAPLAPAVTLLTSIPEISEVTDQVIDGRDRR